MKDIPIRKLEKGLELVGQRPIVTVRKRCPKCGAGGKWASPYYDDGIICFYCGYIVYHFEPIKIKERLKRK